MVKEKDISLVIPTYNSEKTILQTIAAAKKFLTDHSYEIIIVDDGSSDNTVDVINGIDDNLRILALSHHGVCYARNIGIHQAKGKYVMFCDADDQLIGSLPQFNYDEDIISFSKRCTFKNTVCESKEGKYCLIASMFDFGSDKPNFPAFYGGSVSKLFKRSYLITNELLFDEHLTNSEDVLFNAQAILLAHKIRIIQQGIYLYQGRSSSVTHSFDPKLLDNHIYFIKQIQSLLKENQVLISKIASLYLYQLIYRYFALIKNPRLGYQKWCNSINELSIKPKWNEKLNRPIEWLTIKLVNTSGISSAVIFARIYNYLKQRLKKGKTTTEIL